MRAAIVALIAALTVAGCGNVQSQTEDRFRTIHVDGVRCVIWTPYDGNGDGAQMECDFR